ncbi:LLM class F420-dependent oxidoreductase [Mycolicibacterium holsaticum]|uniref:LLM class F420-dependent oxidoreductase n=1 Tax=Mycolicibacterium holsaticum TaxID=152142 RepID=UPI001C7D35A4|nr:LLM class F420-dependent oxidoreductase [Mycolicibacterium holsaticum]MDA4110731.1 luciferase [Mycolicibacterium holsaticum DSM 44478 = JCM 12374]QZA14320.1 LLM class F420-dependent oxidoreductase [Mycolicibacterium holsaticum DSM 44478 = JCM 12374]UNC08230.1 LLM class F420-dependent oxidoreductase [Mycolicibacterium holsaticum DSM 44478 = JCM 12374]
MRIGLSTPVVIQMPAAANAWERDAGIEDIARIAQVADELGFDYLTCSEHVAVPADDAAVRGSVYWDPLATLAFLAARTSRIRLATSVVVLGYHHPLALAKRYGTLDRVSGGRLVLGVGVGSLSAEFDLLGASWADRGARADDAIRALRASLSTPNPAYAGEYYHYESMMVEPCAVQPRVPIWVGGRSMRSLRRAVELADGWMPFGLRGADMARMLAAVERPPLFDVVLPVGPLDPCGDRDTTAQRLRKLADLGATAVTCSLTAATPDEYCDQLTALRTVADGM